MRTTAILASLVAEPRASKSACENSGEFPGCIAPWRKCMRWCIAVAIALLAVSAAAFDAAGGAPSITIVSPQSTVQPISTPVRIEVSFETSPDARIVPDTFKVLYGAFKIDVTSKIRRYACRERARTFDGKSVTSTGDPSFAIEPALRTEIALSSTATTDFAEQEFGRYVQRWRAVYGPPLRVTTRTTISIRGRIVSIAHTTQSTLTVAGSPEGMAIQCEQRDGNAYQQLHRNS